MVNHPANEPQERCALCGEKWEQYTSEFASNYANLVCESCDKRAMTEEPLKGPEDS